MQRLAVATEGACEFVEPGEEAVERAVLRMFSRLLSIRLTDLTLEWPADVTPEWVSPLPPFVFNGDRVNVFAMFRNLPDCEVRLMGKTSMNNAPHEIGRLHLPDWLQTGSMVWKIAKKLRYHPGGNQGLKRHEVFLSGTSVASDGTAFQIVGSDGSLLCSVFRQHRLPLFEMYKPLPRLGRPIQDPNVRFWSALPNEEGMTPFEVRDWLRKTPTALWPTTYIGLLQFGLDFFLVDWLERVMTSHAGNAHPGHDVVREFLNLMSTQALDEPEPAPKGWLGDLKSKVLQTCGRGQRTTAQIPAYKPLTLRGVLAADLVGITADKWPQHLVDSEDGAYAVRKPSQ